MLHIATMAHAVRISDDLYAMARLEAGVMHRSVAQQIEHWAAIGQAVEARGDFSEVRESSIAHMRARDHHRVRAGRLRAKELHVFPEEWAREAKIAWPKDAFAEYRRR
jgi:hypothetical protein